MYICKDRHGSGAHFPRGAGYCTRVRAGKAAPLHTPAQIASCRYVHARTYTHACLSPHMDMRMPMPMLAKRCASICREEWGGPTVSKERRAARLPCGGDACRVCAWRPGAAGRVGWRGGQAGSREEARQGQRGQRGPGACVCVFMRVCMVHMCVARSLECLVCFFTVSGH